MSVLVSHARSKVGPEVNEGLLDHPRIRPIPSPTAADASLGRRLVYRLWPLLPHLARRLAFRLAARQVTLGACAVISDSRGRVLVAHHSYRRQGWGLPGGLVGKREQPFAALERELREELGTDARIGPLIESEVEDGHLTLYYLATITGTPSPDGVEIDQFRFVTPVELSALVGSPAPSWLAHLGTRQAS